MLKRLALAVAALAIVTAALAKPAAEPVGRAIALLDARPPRSQPEGAIVLPKLVLEDARVDPRAQVVHVTARLAPAVPPTTTVVVDLNTRNGSDLIPGRRATLATQHRSLVFRTGDPPVQSVSFPLAGVQARNPGAWFEVLGRARAGVSDSKLVARVTFEPGAENRPAPFRGRPEAKPQKGELVYELDPATFRASENGGRGVARTRYNYGRWPDDDIGYYTDPELHPGTRSWEVRGGELVLRGEKFERPLTVEIRGAPKTFEYGSSVLTWNWLSQRYGYYEVEAMTSGARGTWSAFWLLPSDDTWPPEIDVFEHPRNGQVGKGHTTAALHWKDAKGGHRQVNAHIDLEALLGRRIDTTREFHTYGVDWRADYTTYYFDGREIWRTPTRFHKPAFPLLDVAIAGKWAGPPDLSTGTNEMRVRALRVWK